MSIYWVQHGADGPSTQYKLSTLIKSIIDAEDPIPGVKQVIELAGVLILSNHLYQASDLLSAAYNFAAQTSDAQLVPSLAYQVFWDTHPALKRPDQVPDISVGHLASTRWGKYRECTRTGWMMDSWGIAEPEDPSVWRETDDPIMLAMCARLQAKTVLPETYPPVERMREALAAARKLYALPELPISEWLATRPGLKASTTPPPMQGRASPLRHSTLVYRRLAVELALRLGEFQTAADLLDEGLMRDGLAYDASVYHFLLLPGIYEALPLLAEGGGTDKNPIFISKGDAAIMTDGILGALTLRSTKGRQWELAEGKVGWQELLHRLAAAAWKVHRREYRASGVRSADDILYPPATEEEIDEAEKNVGELPADLKDMVRVANGFKGGYHLFAGGIAGIQGMQLEDAYSELEHLVDEFATLQLRQDDQLTGKIIRLEEGAMSDGFAHLIIPPAVWKANVVGREVGEGEYQYFHWAAWHVGINRWNSIRDFVASCVEEVEGMAERGEEGDFDGDSGDSGDSDDSDDSDDSG